MKNLLKEIKQNCSDIIEIYKYTESFLYRGLRSSYDDVVKLVPRENRLPKNMPLNFHYFINKCMNLANLGVNRSNGIFVTTSQDFAKSFGKVYVFFPVNGYTYVWSDQIIDFTFFKMLDIIFDNDKRFDHYFSGWIFFIGDDMRSETTKYFVIEKNRKTALEELKKYLYQKTNDRHERKIISMSKDLNLLEYNQIKNLLYDKSRNGYDPFFLSWLKKYAENAFESPLFIKEISNIFKTIYKKNEDIEYLLLRNFSNEIIFRCDYYYVIEKDLFFSDSVVYNHIME